jgi:hypothetical protein
MMNLFAEV